LHSAVELQSISNSSNAQPIEVELDVQEELANTLPHNDTAQLDNTTMHTSPSRTQLDNSVHADDGILDLQTGGNTEKDSVDGILATEPSSIEEQLTINCTSVNEHVAALMSNTNIFPLNDSINLECVHHSLEETINLVLDSTTPNRPSSADIPETNTDLPTQPTLSATETTIEAHPEMGTHQQLAYNNPFLMEETTCNISWILSQEPMMLPFSLPPQGRTSQ
jgi:hypothetical protein